MNKILRPQVRFKISCPKRAGNFVLFVVLPFYDGVVLA